MKKLLLVFTVAAFFTACNSTTSSTETTGDSTTVTTTDSSAAITTDSSAVKTDSTSAVTDSLKVDSTNKK